MEAVTASDKQSAAIEVSVFPAQHLLHSVIHPSIRGSAQYSAD